ncbi:gas vesicle protein, partial [Streptomyces sp. NPDC005046]
LERDSSSTTIPELLSGGAAKSIGKRKVRKAAESVGDTVRKPVGGGDDHSDEPDENEEEQQERPRKRRAPARSGSSRRRTAEA